MSLNTLKKRVKLLQAKHFEKMIRNMSDEELLVAHASCKAALLELLTDAELERIVSKES
jgi:ribosomal protein L29